MCNASATRATLATVCSHARPCATKTACTAPAQNLGNAFVIVQRTQTATTLICLPGRETSAPTACKERTCVTSMPLVRRSPPNSAAPAMKAGQAMGRHASRNARMSIAATTASVSGQTNAAAISGGLGKNATSIAAATSIRRVQKVSANAMNASTLLVARRATAAPKMRGVLRTTCARRALATDMGHATRSPAIVIALVQPKDGTATNACPDSLATPVMVAFATMLARRTRTE